MIKNFWSLEFYLLFLLVKFPYIKGRPRITARLFLRKKKFRYLELLIDSGADYTMISKQDASVLGIVYKKIKQPETRIEVANLTPLKAKRISLKIIIGEELFTIPVLVADGVVESLLGRKGIFEYFDITFRERNNEVVFEKI